MRATILLLLAALVSACDQPAASGTVTVLAVAGPTCPVVSDPPDPDCEDRPVDGAVIVVSDASGGEVARMTTDADGRAAVELAPGRYVLVPQTVEGLMGTAGPIEVTVVERGDAEPVLIAYDTGIR
jgi:Carboxypeptidase regulatory-like domain